MKLKIIITQTVKFTKEEYAVLIDICKNINLESKQMHSSIHKDHEDFAKKFLELHNNKIYEQE